jgi:hypothetical protein
MNDDNLQRLQHSCEVPTDGGGHAGHKQRT